MKATLRHAEFVEKWNGEPQAKHLFFGREQNGMEKVFVTVVPNSSKETMMTVMPGKIMGILTNGAMVGS